MDLYRLDPAERDELRALAANSGESGWWVPYADVIRPTYQRFIGLEAAATGLDEYAAKLVPGLLQSDDYMRAVMESDQPPLKPEIIERRMQVRHMRQEEWDAREVPTRYLLDESVLLRQVGSRATMAGSLRLISEVAHRPNVSVRVIPLKSGHAISVLGGFAIMSFAVMPPVAVSESLTGDLYADREDADVYTMHFKKLSAVAAPVLRSMKMIEDAGKGFA